MARRRREEDVADVADVPSKRPGASAFAAIAGRSKSFRPARETLRRVRAVPTIFPYVDWKMRVGGYPIDRVGVVHGPSAAGKTMYCHGLGLSFLRRGHMYCLIDAEMTTPIPWLETLMGDHADNPAFLASRPKSYEQVVDDVRRIAESLAEQRDRGRLPPDTTCLFVVDSIRKLVPEDIQARIKKMGAEGEKGSVDGYSGAAGRMRAALNASWLDELTPLMYHAGCAVLFVGRESEDPNASARAKQFGADWKLTGGKALFLDSSIFARVSKATMVAEGEGADRAVLGERHLVEIHKTKVSARQDVVERAYFHTSNGSRTPEGFERSRDLLLLGTELGVVKRSGGWVSHEGRRWRSESSYAATATPAQLDAIEAACRAKFGEDVGERAEVVGG